MDFALTDEQEMIVDTIRTFVDRELVPHEDDVERLGEVPPDLVTVSYTHLTLPTNREV